MENEGDRINKKIVVERIIRAKLRLESKKTVVCHLEADPDGYACSCGEEARSKLINPALDDVIEDLDSALTELLG